MAETSRAHQEEGGLVEVGEDPQEAALQPTKEREGKPKAAVKYKK
jgi:hypothetical protein